MWEAGAKSRLEEVCHDIDHFLDPSSASDCHLSSLGPSGPSDSTKETKETKTLSKGQEALEIQRLSRRNEDLEQQLEDCQHEFKTRLQPKLLSRESEQRREDMDLDAKVKKRRLSEMENELAKLRQERDLLEYELKEAQEERQREKASRLKATEECRKQEEDLKNTISSLESELQNSKQSQLPLKTNPDAWKARVSELEQEVFYLRLLLKDWYPEHELASQLRSKHVEFEHEMHESHKTVEDLLHAKERILSLEQEKISLQAALEIQEASLKQCKDAASQSTRAKQDQALYEASIADILHAARQLGPELPEDIGDPTPANLRIAWSRLHSHWTKEAHKTFELEQKLHDAADQQNQFKTEMNKLQIDMSLANLQSTELQGRLKESEDTVQNLKAQNSVLREALAGKHMQFPEIHGEVDAKMIRTADSFQEAQQEAVEVIKREAAVLKNEVGRLADVERKLRKVEGVNAELWQANKELERRILQLHSQEIDVANADYDPRTTKILHLVRGPQDEAAGSGCDLEQQQAARQLERYKKATKKYVSEFREGLYHLLGWKVEMRGDGNSLRWHLTSRYGQVRQELVFQLRPGRSGQPAEFDLLETPWAEQLQTDRQAMSYLEVYNSIPGFLAHVTVDRFAQQTFTR